MIHPLKPPCPECQAQGFHLARCSAHFDNRQRRLAPSGSANPDLRAQLDDVMAAVQLAEANWQFDDRLDLAARREGWV